MYSKDQQTLECKATDTQWLFFVDPLVSFTAQLIATFLKIKD